MSDSRNRAGDEMSAEPCRCGHLAYFHTRMVANPELAMVGVPCRSEGCACADYVPDSLDAMEWIFE